MKENQNITLVHVTVGIGTQGLTLDSPMPYPLYFPLGCRWESVEQPSGKCGRVEGGVLQSDQPRESQLVWPW